MQLSYCGIQGLYLFHNESATFGPKTAKNVMQFALRSFER